MSRMVLDAIYLGGLAVAEGLRFRHRFPRARSEGQERRRLAPRELVVMPAVFLGMWALPGAYIFTPCLRPLDYALPAWTAWPAAAVFVAGLAVRWAAHSALGDAWSPTGDGARGSGLVTSGIYGWIRHPIYAAMILWAAAQPLLLRNVLAGWGGAAAVALMWAVRVPEEERLLRRRFGEPYAAYARATGRLIPRATRSPQGGPMHYLLFYDVGPEYLERRAQFRSQHLAVAWAAHRRGELVLGGALADPVDGAVLLFSGDSAAVAERFAKGDPYVLNGLVRSWRVRPWTTVVGETAAAPVREF